jgi:hypothetical protein
MLSWVFIVLAHWNNSLWVDMSLHLDTLFWFRAIQSLLFLLTAACLEEKQQIPIFIVFGLTRPGLEPTIYRTRGEQLTITPPMWLPLMEVEAHYQPQVLRLPYGHQNPEVSQVSSLYLSLFSSSNTQHTRWSWYLWKFAESDKKHQ